jgi:hypothetical protein
MSATIASSISLRLRVLAQRIYSQGPAPLHEVMCAIAGGADAMSVFEHYGAFALCPDHGGTRELAPTIRLVK